MIKNILVSCCAILLTTNSYIQEYKKESWRAIDFCKEHKEQINKLHDYLSSEESLLAMCVIAPELSQYSNIMDIAETYSLKVLYVQGEISNFSIGPFQMKPTFAENIEFQIVNDDILRQKYGLLVIKGGSAREIRYERVKRLSSLEWQIIYLAAFIDIVKEETKSILNTDNLKRLKYWATLYNSGLHKNSNDVSAFLERTEFPRKGKYNYANICIEFYEYQQYCQFLR